VRCRMHRLPRPLPGCGWCRFLQRSWGRHRRVEAQAVVAASSSPQLGEASAVAAGAGSEHVTGAHDGAAGGVGAKRSASCRSPLPPARRCPGRAASASWPERSPLCPVAKRSGMASSLR
jgi:hypothetical protein